MPNVFQQNWSPQVMPQTDLALTNNFQNYNLNQMGGGYHQQQQGYQPQQQQGYPPQQQQQQGYPPQQQQQQGYPPQQGHQQQGQ